MGIDICKCEMIEMQNEIKISTLLCGITESQGEFR